jgi:hypothetical protein
MARSFSCGYNIELCQATLDDVEDYAPVGQTVDFGTINTEVCVNSCSGAPVGSGGAGYFYGWSSQNSNIAPISGSASSQSANVYGNSIGKTYINSWVADDFCYVQVPQAPVTVPPAITAVSPLVYGQQGGPLIISGSGFSSYTGAVTLSFTNPGITGSGTVTSNTQITGTYNVGCGVPLNQVNTVTVSGNWSDGPLPTPAYPVSIGLPSLSTPTISFGGNPVSGTQSVVVGRQINLTGSLSLPNCMSMQSQSWSQPPGTAIGGFTNTAGNGPPSSTSGQVQPMPALNTSGLTFYWTSPGNPNPLNVSYSQIASTTSGDGYTEASPQATAAFSVVGPTASFPPGSLPTGSVGIFGGPVLGYGPIGIQFKPTTSPPPGDSGQFKWGQLITSDQYTLETVSGTTKNCVNDTLPTQSPNGTGLDTEWPYATGASTQDSPNIGLNSALYQTEARAFSAQMYFFWDPALPAQCTPGTSCTSIPVPLGSVSWGWSGTAAYEEGNWTLTSSGTTAPSWAAGSSYPGWSDYVPYTGLSCH